MIDSLLALGREHYAAIAVGTFMIALMNIAIDLIMGHGHGVVWFFGGKVRTFDLIVGGMVAAIMWPLQFFFWLLMWVGWMVHVFKKHSTIPA